MNNDDVWTEIALLHDRLSEIEITLKDVHANAKFLRNVIEGLSRIPGIIGKTLKGLIDE